MNKIVCFGEALIDFLADPVRLSAEPRTFQQNAGGAPANVAVAIAALGGDAAFVGMLSEDMFGDFLLASLAQARVDTSFIKRTNAANTALAFVSLDAAGERSFNFYRPPAADLLFREQHFHALCFTGLAAFHACSNSLTEAAIASATLDGMARARMAGALVSFDMNWRPRLWDAAVDPLPRIWLALQAADLVKLSEEEMAYLARDAGGEVAVLARLWRGHTQLLVITCGAEPLHWHTPAKHGSTPVVPADVVDTTGAGDAFVGGLLTRLTEQAVRAADLQAFAHSGALASSLRFAAACGSVAVGRRGAFAAMPNRHDVQALLEAPA